MLKERQRYIWEYLSTVRKRCLTEVIFCTLYFEKDSFYTVPSYSFRDGCYFVLDMDFGGFLLNYTKEKYKGIFSMRGDSVYLLVEPFCIEFKVYSVENNVIKLCDKIKLAPTTPRQKFLYTSQ